MKKIFSLLLVCAMVLTTALALTACGKDGEEAAFVSVDINPSVELVVEDGKVVSVYGANEDGMVLLYSEEDDIVGADVEDAVARITEIAIELGYISEENTVVGTTVSSEDEAYAEKLNEKLGEKIVASADENGITVTTSSGETYSLTRRLEKLKAENPENEEIQNLTTRKFRLALAASETGEIELEVAVTTDDAALIEMINEHHKSAEEFATVAFSAAKLAADRAYETTLGTLTDSLYLEYYVTNILKHGTEINDPILYQIYTGSERTLDYLADAVAMVSDVRNYPLGDEAVAAALDAFGLTADDRDKIENLNGEVTVKSIEAYADKLFKNSEAGAELEAKMSELDATLDSFSKELNEMKSEILDEYGEEIEQMKELADETVSKVASLLPAETKAAINSLITTYSEALDKLIASTEDSSITATEIRESAALFGAKADELEEKMKTSIGEDGVAAIADKKEALETKLSAAKAELDSALEAAESEAKTFLENVRNERISRVQS